MIGTGDRLPAFSLPDQDGRERTFATLSGPKGLVLYFYPKDDTPGCTLEATDFQRLLPRFRAAGYEVAGVSRDGAASHGRFREKHGLAFPLLTDADASFSSVVGAFGEKVLYGRKSVGMIRSTLVVDRDGTVRKSYPKVSAKGHAEAVLRFLEGGGS